VATYHAFADVYAAEARSLWAYLRRLGADPDLASDLSQESFVRWLDSVAADLTGSRARAYLFSIASNLLVDHWRRSQRELSWDDAGGEQIESAPAGDDGMPPHVWHGLSRRQRQLLWLAYAEEFSHDEIAAICRLESGSVRVLLSRARARARTLLEAGVTR